jgi:hypothetical protein
MTDRRDDDFRVRPNAPKNRGKGQGQSFVSKVLKQTGKASSGKSTMRRPGGSGKGASTGQRPGSRLGRGHTAARFAGAKLTPMSRRVTIKTLLVNQQRASAIAPPSWRPNGWGRAPSWRSNRPFSVRWSKSGGRASTARCNARPARMAGCRSNASTNRGCNASARC